MRQSGSSLFDDWSEEAKQRHRILRRRDTNTILPDNTPVTNDVEELLPIIPLLGTAASRIDAPCWPQYTKGRLKTLRSQVSARANAVARRLIDHTTGFWKQQLLRLAWCAKRRDVLNSLMQRIEKGLHAHGSLLR